MAASTRYLGFLHDHVAGAAGFFKLWKHAKEATQNQGAILNKFDPFQSSLDEWIKDKVEKLFNKYINNNRRYEELKKYSSLRLFPNTQAVLDLASAVEQKAANIEQKIYHLTHQNRAILYVEMTTITGLIACATIALTVHPVKLVMITGIYLSIIRNSSAFPKLLRDFQLCAKMGRHILKQPLAARLSMKSMAKIIVEGAYPEAEKEHNPQTYHLKSLIRYLSERIFGTKEKFEEKIEGVIENHACRQIREFEKKQRFQLLSRITNSALKKLTTIVASQAFRMIITNLTGLGIVALLYWGSHRFVNTTHDSCGWRTPLEYSWNRVAPLNWLHKFPEQCHRYVYLTWASDITKWVLRFYIWNKMIHVWEASREKAVEDLLEPVIDWSQRTWQKIARTFAQTTTTANQKISNIFAAIGNKFNPSYHTNLRENEIINLELYTHLPLSIAFHTSLEKATTV